MSSQNALDCCRRCDCVQYFPMPVRLVLSGILPFVTNLPAVCVSQMSNQLTQNTTQPECACAHSIEDHSPTPPLARRFCGNGNVFAPVRSFPPRTSRRSSRVTFVRCSNICTLSQVGLDSPTDPRASCVHCGRRYFVHYLSAQPSNTGADGGAASTALGTIQVMRVSCL